MPALSGDGLLTGTMASGTGSPGRISYRPGLDGLRAIAVAAVLVYHADARWAPGGFLGVDLFFVISGFLITTLLINEVQRTGRISLESFYRRRARRLLPALGLVLGCTVAVMALLAPRDLATAGGDILASVGYVANWWFIGHHESYFQSIGRPSPVQHLWSLAVEEQFYLVWPLVVATILAAGATRRRIGALAGVALGGAVASTAWMAVLAVAHDVPYGTDASRVYLGTDTHAMGVLLGAAAAAALALVPERRRAALGDVAEMVGILGLGGIIWAFFGASEFTPALYRGGFLAFAALSVLAVLGAEREGGWLGEALGAQPLRWLGTRSYGVYIWHWPIYVLTRPQLDVNLTPAADFVLRLALTLAAAEASYRFVEEPIRRKGLQAWLQGLSGLPGLARRWQRQPERRQAEAWAPASLGTPARPATGIRLRPEPAFAAACIVLTLGAGIVVGASSRVRPAPGRPVAAARAAASLPRSSQPGPFPPGRSTPSQPGSSTPVPAPAAPAAPTAAPPPAAWSLTAVGDSVMLGAQSEIEKAFPGATVNASEGRQAPSVFSVVQAMAASGHLGKSVVLQLGTNGTIDPAALGRMLTELGGRRVVILNVHVPRPWQNADNAVLARAVHAVRGVVLVDWNAAASKHPEWLYDDGVHLRSAGAEEYAALIAKALGGSG